MKLKDLAFIGAVVLLLAPFFLSNDLYAAYLACNASHPYLMALLKFGILSTAGEVIGLRIQDRSLQRAGDSVSCPTPWCGSCRSITDRRYDGNAIGRRGGEFRHRGVAATMRGRADPC